MLDLSTLACPKCGSSEPNKKYIQDGAFICTHKNDTGGTCGEIVAIFCKSCEKIYAEDRFGYRCDAYECKECGRVQWGYTEYKKNRSSLEKDIAVANSKYIKFANQFDAMLSSKK